MIRKTRAGRQRLFHGAMVTFALAATIFGVVATAHAAGAAVFSAASPASGAAVPTKPMWLSVNADDTAPIIAATMTVNGLPVFVQITRPVGHWSWDEEQESDIWVVDDLSVTRLMSYMGYTRGNPLVLGTNTVVATVTSASGASTYSWTFEHVTATTVNSVSPASGAVLPDSPSAITAGLTSPSSSFTSAMKLDGVLVPTTYTAQTKTFTHTPAASLSPGAHTVTFTASGAQGGAVTKTWSFKVSPPMSSGDDCTSCHTTFPAAHPVAGCSDCHDHAYAPIGKHGGQIPTVAGCTGDGVNNGVAECHQLDHSGDMGRGSTPFTCAECHSATYPSVPRHTDASTTAVHASASTACGPCHSESLVTEHAKYPTAAAVKYQCDLCHSPAVRQQVKDAVIGGLTNCDACHTVTDHASIHTVTAPPACSATGCHTGTSLTTIHATPGCDGCHASADPAVVDAIATGQRDCVACHPGDPHPAAVHTAAGTCVAAGCHVANVSTLHAAGPSCDACHAVGKTPSLACTSCHTGTLHATANHTSTETCDACHNITDLASVHGDNCGTCHPTPASSLTWSGKCSQAACHPTSHTRFTTHQGDHGDGPDCWDCHDGDSYCNQCHGVYDRTAPVTTSNAVASYAGTATITLSRSDAGGSGIRKTYYQLDGGILSNGTVVVVSPPASGAETRTLDFWSTDNGYNTEVHRHAVFLVRAP